MLKVMVGQRAGGVGGWLQNLTANSREAPSAAKQRLEKAKTVASGAKAPLEWAWLTAGLKPRPSVFLQSVTQGGLCGGCGTADGV